MDGFGCIVIHFNRRALRQHNYQELPGLPELPEILLELLELPELLEILPELLLLRTLDYYSSPSRLYIVWWTELMTRLQ